MDPPASQLEPHQEMPDATTSNKGEWASALMKEVSTRLVEMHALIDEGEELTTEEGEEFEQLYLLEAQLQLGHEPDEALLEAHRARQWADRPRTPHLLCLESCFSWNKETVTKDSSEDDEDWVDDDVYLPQTTSRQVSTSHLLLWYTWLTHYQQ